jgi:CRP/FNR family cyclic AMP-dependent transcriptional regulator
MFCPTGELRVILDGLKTSSAFEPGAVAFHESAPCHSVFIVCEGRVKLTTASRSGQTLLLRLAGAGELLAAADAVSGVPYSSSAVAVEPSILASIPRETFLRLVGSYPAVACRLTRSLSAEYKFAQHETRFLGFGETSTARLARLLIDWATDERGGGATPHIPAYITHTDLAQAIGATRETVTRILSELRHRGVIAREQEAIVIRDAVELAALAASERGDGEADLRMPCDTDA